MKILLKNVLINPFGIGLVIIHWGIFLVALAFIQVDKFDKVRPSATVAFLILGALFIFDLPAIIPMALLFLPLYLLEQTYFSIVILFSFFTITFQWLLIGRKIYKIFWLKDNKILKLNIAE